MQMSVWISATKMFLHLIPLRSSLLLTCLVIATLSPPVIAVTEASAIAALDDGLCYSLSFPFVFITFSFYVFYFFPQISSNRYQWPNGIRFSFPIEQNYQSPGSKYNPLVFSSPPGLFEISVCPSWNIICLETKWNKNKIARYYWH